MFMLGKPLQQVVRDVYESLDSFSTADSRLPLAGGLLRDAIFSMIHLLNSLPFLRARNVL